MPKDYYSILGIERSASDVDIKKAFRKLAHEYHPDKKSGNETKFKEINEAYQVLSNAEKRKQYDRFGSTSDNARGGGFNWQDINQGGGPFGGYEGFSQAQSFDFGDLGDVLGSMFGFGGQQGGRTSQAGRGADVETRVHISFDEAYFGTDQQMTLSLLRSCLHCGGSGNDLGSKITTCSNCKGSGTVTHTQATFLGSIRAQSICSQCRGTGKRAERQCGVCHGSTVTKQQQNIIVHVPAGIDDTRSIRLSGKGEAGAHNGPAGDLYIRVTVASHPYFEREGYDIKSRENIPLSTLVMGGSVSVRTPTGNVKLKVPSHTQSGTQFALRGKGFERLSGKGRGDQYVTVHAYVPKKINSRQRKLLEDFEQELNMDESAF